MGIYNADYDLKMIRQVNAQHSLQRSAENARAFCIMHLYSRWDGERHPSSGELRWHKLEAARQRCHISLLNSHRAHADALLARALLRHMAGVIEPAQ